MNPLAKVLRDLSLSCLIGVALCIGIIVSIWLFVTLPKYADTIIGIFIIAGFWNVVGAVIFMVLFIIIEIIDRVTKYYKKKCDHLGEIYD